MGQAQRSDGGSVLPGRAEGRSRQHSAERRRRQNRTGNARKSSARDGISLISAGSPSGRTAGHTKRNGSGERSVRQRSTERSGLENLELWEISREENTPRMMRLANSGQSRSGARPDPVRRNTGNPRPVSSIRQRRTRKRRLNLYRIFVFLMIGVCLILIYQTTGAIYHMVHKDKTDSGRGIVQIVSEKIEANRIQPPPITVDYLEPNEFSRPGTELKKIKSVFVHYTANPGTSAAQNRSYFAGLAETQERSASAHFIIGYEGELIQCIPLEEQAYAVATRNEDSVSIECCYLDEDGKFTQETYDTLVHTLAWLTQEYHLSVDDILRHYDCGGKKCPLYYVEHEDAWEKLLSDVDNYKPEKP